MQKITNEEKIQIEETFLNDAFDLKAEEYGDEDLHKLIQRVDELICLRQSCEVNNDASN